MRTGLGTDRHVELEWAETAGGWQVAWWRDALSRVGKGSRKASGRADFGPGCRIGWG